MENSSYSRALSLFDHRYRSVISVLFDARNEDYRLSRLRENPQVSAEAVEFMRALDLIEIEDGTIALNRDLVEFLERTLGVSDFVMTGRIGEINVDIQRFYNLYETCSTGRDRATLALRIKRLSKQLNMLGSMIRSHGSEELYYKQLDRTRRYIPNWSEGKELMHIIHKYKKVIEQETVRELLSRKHF